MCFVVWQQGTAAWLQQSASVLSPCYPAVLPKFAVLCLRVIELFASLLRADQAGA
jgi:hypothetical protein